MARQRGVTTLPPSDASIESQARRRLASLDWDASRVRVSVDRGELILEGEAPDREAARQAASSVAGIPGVQRVNERLRIGTSEAEDTPRR